MQLKIYEESTQIRVNQTAKCSDCLLHIDVASSHIHYSLGTYFIVWYIDNPNHTFDVSNRCSSTTCLPSYMMGMRGEQYPVFNTEIVQQITWCSRLSTVQLASSDLETVIMGAHTLTYASNMYTSCSMFSHLRLAGKLPCPCGINNHNENDAFFPPILHTGKIYNSSYR